MLRTGRKPPTRSWRPSVSRRIEKVRIYNKEENPLFQRQVRGGRAGRQARRPASGVIRRPVHRAAGVKRNRIFFSANPGEPGVRTDPGDHQPLYNEEGFPAKCHAHPNRKRSGVIDVTMSLRDVDAEMTRARAGSSWSTRLNRSRLLIVALVLIHLSRAGKELVLGTRISDGDLNHFIPSRRTTRWGTRLPRSTR